MTASLTQILSEISQVALSSGCASVELVKINMKDTADTLLPKLFLKVTGVEYSKKEGSSAYKTFSLDLTFITNNSDNPVIFLDNLVDTFLFGFSTNAFLTRLEDDIEYISSTLTNERDMYSVNGGEGVTLRMRIGMITNFNGVTC